MSGKGNIYPHETKTNKGPVTNPSDLPQVTTEGLRKLSRFVPNGKQIRKDGGLVELKPTTIRKGYTLVRGVLEIPQEKIPLTSVFRVSFGGGRVYGGGTSEKSLRTARKKAKRANGHK